MLKSEKWPIINLQLFADGGEGGDGGNDGASGVEAEPGLQRLRDLGVPESQIKPETARKFAQRMGDDGSVRKEASKQAEGAPKEEGSPTRQSLSEILKDPDYNKEFQSIFAGRVKGAKESEAHLQAMQPALQLLAGNYGLDPENMDYDELSKAISGDTRFYEDAALEHGRSLEDEMHISQMEMEARAARQQRERDVQQQAVAEHFHALEEQAAELQKEFPDFDLRTALRNEAFANAVRPSGGLNLRQAYYAFNGDQIRAQQAQEIARNASNAIQSGMNRPREAGQSSAAPSSAKLDIRGLSKSQRATIQRKMQEASARGEVVTPSMFI